MSSIDLVELEIIAAHDFEEFKTSYHHPSVIFIGTQYYNTLKAEADTVNNSLIGNYAVIAGKITENSGYKGLYENEFSRLAAEKVGVDLSFGSDEWLELQYEKMQADISARITDIANGGDGNLNYAETNAVVEQAYQAVGVPPEAAYTYQPLSDHGAMFPAQAEAAFETYNSSATAETLVGEFLLFALHGTPIDQGPAQAYYDLADKASWISTALQTFSNLASTYNSSHT